jgi:hypothetical protein
MHRYRIFKVSHAARCVTCHGVRSHAVLVDRRCSTGCVGAIIAGSPMPDHDSEHLRVRKADAERVACHGVLSHAVPVAVVGEHTLRRPRLARDVLHHGHGVLASSH